jgi:hypothetical protein
MVAVQLRVCLATLVVLAACGREPAPAVSMQHREFVQAAVERLRVMFNQGACEAVELELPTAANKTEWLATCEQIRTEWGTWDSFQASGWNRPSSRVVGVEGTAKFAGGERHMSTLWDLGAQQPRMLLFLLTSGEQSILFPALGRGTSIRH